MLIVGAGHAGVALAAALTKVTGAGSVTLIGEEPHLPYERPLLSKRLLYEQAWPDPVPLRTSEYWEKSPSELRLGERVVAVDPQRRTVGTESGDSFSYGQLVWAAGGSAARIGLTGDQLAGVHTLRSFSDLTALREDLTSAGNVVVVGGGYLGLEAAASLRTVGLTVSVVESAPRLLSRVTCELLSEHFRALHRSHGVDVHVGVGVDALLGDVRVQAVQLSDGRTLPADVVLLGVGMRPVVDPLLEAGAEGDRLGIRVDAHCRTSLPDVYAIGDCACQNNPYALSPATAMRVESVHNATQHAATVARSVADLEPLDPTPPRFWSTQYDVELRTVGLPDPGDEQIVRGDVNSAAFSVLYLREGRLAAVDAVNRPRDFARAQALVAARWEPPSGGSLADPSQELPRP